MTVVYRCKNAAHLYLARLYIALLIMFALSGAAAVFSYGAGAVIALSSLVLCSSAALGASRRTELFRAEIDNTRIVISRSASIAKETVIERGCVQYVQLVQTPLQRCFNACSLVLRTISGGVIVTDLSPDDAVKFMKGALQ